MADDHNLHQDKLFKWTSMVRFTCTAQFSYTTQVVQLFYYPYGRFCLPGSFKSTTPQFV